MHKSIFCVRLVDGKHHHFSNPGRFTNSFQQTSCLVFHPQPHTFKQDRDWRITSHFMRMIQVKAKRTEMMTQILLCCCALHCPSKSFLKLYGTAEQLQTKNKLSYVHQDLRHMFSVSTAIRLFNASFLCIITTKHAQDTRTIQSAHKMYFWRQK